MCPLATVLADRRFLLWTLAAAAVALLGFGLVSAIIPNPVFGRSVPPEPFAIVVWLVSAPLMGLLAATFMVPARRSNEADLLGSGPVRRSDGAVLLGAGLTSAAPLGPGSGSAAVAAVAGIPAGATATATADGRDGSLLGTVAGVGAFLAIGCPLCNKIALVALGASGAMSIWAPLQPIVGAASVVLLAGTVVWRLRRRAAGDLCAAPLRAR